MSTTAKSESNPKSSSDPGKPPDSPNSGWFPKGRSGNPKGRPRGSASRTARTPAVDVLLDKTVTVTKGDEAREISIEDALQQRTFKDALTGKRMAVREVVRWIIKREAWFARHEPRAAWPKITSLISPDPDNADAALVLLGIARPNPARADIGATRAQLLLEPWAVQAALHRKRGGQGLTDRERDEVRRCTRDPDSLIWPGHRT